jgi:hypothetical protein
MSKATKCHHPIHNCLSSHHMSPRQISVDRMLMRHVRLDSRTRSVQPSKAETGGKFRNTT